VAKRAVWRTDAFWGVAISILVLATGQSAFTQGVERWAYDMGVRATSREPAPNIAIVAIDENSVQNLGRWPWNREIHAQMFDFLAKAGAKVVASTVFFTEPQDDPAVAQVKTLAASFEKSTLTNLGADSGALLALTEKLGTDMQALANVPAAATARQSASDLQAFVSQSSLGGKAAEDAAKFGALLKAAASVEGQDSRLAASLTGARNVLLPMFLNLTQGAPIGNPEGSLPAYVEAQVLPNITDPEGLAAEGFAPLQAEKVTPPIELLGAAALGIGHINIWPDVDGGVRAEPLVLQYYNTYFPSLSLVTAARSLNLSQKDIEVRIGEGVRLKNLFIRTDGALQMNTFFYADKDGAPRFTVDSFFDVITGKIPPAKYKDKIVLIGPTAEGITPGQVTPLSPDTDGIVRLAHTVSSILQQHFFVAPAWAWIAELVLLLLAAAYLIALFPRLKAGAAAAASLGFIVLLFGIEMGLMVTQTTWLKLMTPMLLVAVGHVLLTTKRFLLTERGKAVAEAASAQNARTLGLAMQQAGQLDMAFDSFQKCPLDDDIMQPLYQLALDFERKRQFNKAGAVYRYMAQHNPKYQDIQTRIQKSEQLESTVVLGGASSHPGATLVLTADQKPTLGRFQVEKELGKGAMGMVYLGKDTKINRQVAIKTMALSQEFEADELAEVKARFFREAESAGRMNHPNIVAIYDVGDEHDLAYIAMEFLKGKDLVPHTKQGNLLPVPKVLEIISKVADALDFAHKQSVVHRDIKPANVMFDPGENTVKVTDFGIARITDSSKTKTGMVLGTPSYMSPEQLSGAKVDGRADLFSLGVMMFQMLTGDLPFKAESLATLMYKIANQEPPDTNVYRHDLPDCVRAIIRRAMMKDPDKRYQTGGEMRDALNKCAAMLGKPA
jgi:serine/threonine-protein kinase